MWSRYLLWQRMFPEFIRVPLDIKRDNVRSLQFRPPLLTDLTTGGILDLLHTLQEIQDIQRHTREKIHFSTPHSKLW